eukprot:837808-Amphidinium_carterae.2
MEAIFPSIHQSIWEFFVVMNGDASAMEPLFEAVPCAQDFMMLFMVKLAAYKNRTHMNPLFCKYHPTVSIADQSIVPAIITVFVVWGFDLVAKVVEWYRRLRQDVGGQRAIRDSSRPG